MTRMVKARRARLLLPIFVSVALAGCGSASSSSSQSAARVGQTTRVKPPPKLVAVLGAISTVQTCLIDRGFPPRGQPAFPTQASNPNAPEGELSVGTLGHGATIIFYASPQAAQRLEAKIISRRAFLRRHVRRVGSRTVVTLHASHELATSVGVCVQS
jgi:hypothetical protein